MFYLQIDQMHPKTLYVRAEIDDENGMKASGWMSGLLLLVYNLFPTAWIRRYPGAAAPAADGRYEAYGVTPRERQVIELIQAGRTNQEIADQLFLSLATVKDYNNRLFRKCGVRNRVELANAGARLILAPDWQPVVWTETSPLVVHPLRASAEPKRHSSSSPWPRSARCWPRSG